MPDDCGADGYLCSLRTARREDRAIAFRYRRREEALSAKPGLNLVLEGMREALRQRKTTPLSAGVSYDCLIASD